MTDMAQIPVEECRGLAVGRAGLEPAAPGLKGPASNGRLYRNPEDLATLHTPPAPRIAPSFTPSTPDPVTLALLCTIQSWIGGCTIVSLRRNLLEILLSLEDDADPGTISAIARPRTPGDGRT